MAERGIWPGRVGRMRDRIKANALWNIPPRNPFQVDELMFHKMPFAPLKSGFTDVIDKFNSLREDAKKYTQLEDR